LRLFSQLSILNSDKKEYIQIKLVKLGFSICKKNIFIIDLGLKAVTLIFKWFIFFYIKKEIYNNLLLSNKMMKLFISNFIN